METRLQLTFVNYKKGAYIIVEGKQEANRFYIIREGRVRISREVLIVTEEQGDILGPGDFFGVVSTMSGYGHIETAQAMTDITLVSVYREQFSKLIQTTTPIAIKIIMHFSKRMRFLNEALAMLTLKKNAEPDASHLFTVGEYFANRRMLNQAYYAYTKYIGYCPDGEHVKATQERLAKISPYVKITRIDFEDNELLRAYPKDSMIFSEGENGKEFYIIKTGSVKISKIAGDNEVLLEILKPGDIFGEMALLESKPRTACAEAFEDCQLMAVNRENFEHMIKTQPQLISRLTTMLAERIWLIYRKLANTRISDPVGRAYDMLLIQLQKKKIDFKDKNPYFFDFGGIELGEMIGLSRGDGEVMIQKMLQNKHIQLINNRIMVDDVLEIARQAASSQRMQEIEGHHKLIY